MRVRTLAWLSIAGQAAFVASWMIAGALQPGYSASRSTISALAARDADHPWIVITGITLFGLSVLALAVALRALLPPRPASHVAVALFTIVGAGLVTAAFARLPCDPQAVQGCRGGDAHGAAISIALIALLGSPFALARAIWPGPVARRLLLGGLVLVAINVAAQAAHGSAATKGSVERWELLVDQAWFVLVAASILHARRQPRSGAPRRDERLVDELAEL